MACNNNVMNSSVVLTILQALLKVHISYLSLINKIPQNLVAENTQLSFTRSFHGPGMGEA